MSATHNGILDTVRRTITHKGDLTWDNTTPGNSLSWDEWTRWVTYTTNSGAGAPLLYETDVIDLGSVKAVSPNINFSGDGTIRPVIQFSETSSDLTSATTTLGQYTANNAIDGTVTTFSVLDYYDNDYADQDSSLNHNYTSFLARYVKISAFVEKFRDTVREVPQLNQFNWTLDESTVEEKVNDLAVSGETTAIPVTTVGAVDNIHITVHSEANKKLVPQIVSKTNKTIRVVDANTFSTAGVSATVDVTVTGRPALRTLFTFGLGGATD